jgi:histidine triad (HIT) family protein
MGDAAERGVIWSDDLVYAGHCGLSGRENIHLGWVMVEPRRHVGELGDLTGDEAAAIGVLSSRVARALCVSEGAEHVYSFVFGDGAARAHLHVHLMPRSPVRPGSTGSSGWSSGPTGPAVASTRCALSPSA